MVEAVEKVGMIFASIRGLGESTSQAFKAIYGRMTLQWEGGAGTCGDSTNVTSGGCTDSAQKIRFWSLSGHGQNDVNRMTKNVIHELGHAYDNALAYPEPNPQHPGQMRRPDQDMSPDFTRNILLRPNVTTELGQRWDWQQSPDNTSNEIFADMFIAWTYNAWNNDPANATSVGDAQNWMNGLVP